VRTAVLKQRPAAPGFGAIAPALRIEVMRQSGAVTLQQALHVARRSTRAVIADVLFNAPEVSARF
jgi:hypothetical protein